MNTFIITIFMLFPDKFENATVIFLLYCDYIMLYYLWYDHLKRTMT